MVLDSYFSPECRYTGYDTNPRILQRTNGVDFTGCVVDRGVIRGIARLWYIGRHKVLVGGMANSISDLRQSPNFLHEFGVVWWEPTVTFLPSRFKRVCQTSESVGHVLDEFCTPFFDL